MPHESVTSRTSEQNLSAFPELTTTLLDNTEPFGVDWKKPTLQLEESERLLRLARLKAILPPGNAVDEKTTHDATLENYIRLALDAAGDTNTIEKFLGHVQHTLETYPDEAQELAQQVFWIWSPVAEIAGMYNHKNNLEESAFKLLLPEEYAKTVAEYNRAILEGDSGPLRRIHQRIDHLLQDSLDERITFQVSSRAKSHYSVWRKLRTEDREAQLFDLLGFRVILDGDDSLATEQCYVAMASIAAEFEADKERLKDYISDPKATGYQSLHLAFYTPEGMPFEFQVRTRRMHEFAESDGALSHQTYEATFKEIPGKIQKSYFKIPRLYRWRNQATAYIRDHGGNTEGFLGDEILFFRSDGNLYKAPANTSALEASFRIHSRRALRTRRIVRNGKLYKYTAPIEHGDVLDIEYAPDYPSKAHQFDGLSRLVTAPHARAAIERGKRQALSEHYISLGRNVVVTMVGNIGLADPLAVLDEVDRHKLAERAGVPTFNDLLRMIGAGNVNGKPSRVASWILARSGFGNTVDIKLVPEALNTLGDDELLEHLVIPSEGGKLECRVAGCCQQKIHYGDPTIVRVSRLEGALKVHRENCNNIRTTENVIYCNWAPRTS